MDTENIIIRRATEKDIEYAVEISAETRSSAIARGIGIADRPPSVVAAKILEGKAVIAVLEDGTWVGFIYYQPYMNGKYISQSGLIVSPAFRRRNVAAGLKKKLFAICRERFPKSTLFSISSSTPILKMNTALGFSPVGYDQLPGDGSFWQGCAGCVKHNILKENNLRHCLCTAMIFTPEPAGAGYAKVRSLASHHRRHAGIFQRKPASLKSTS